MATPAQVGLTIAEANQAQAAINRLAAIARSAGRYQLVRRRASQENGAMREMVIVHDGPLGHGRTIFVEFEKGNRLIRRTVGSDAHGVTSDGWRSIDLTTVV
jgi:hypothetical protein